MCTTRQSCACGVDAAEAVAGPPVVRVWQRLLSALVGAAERGKKACACGGGVLLSLLLQWKPGPLLFDRCVELQQHSTWPPRDCGGCAEQRSAELHLHSKQILENGRHC
eukprot:75710-Pelagomonas_calceolata.AAC.2